MNRNFKVNDREIGNGASCFVIAEAGSNHNGSLETALSLVDVAADSQADAIKFQTFRADRLYTRSAGTSDYLGDERPIFDIIESMEMPESWWPRIRARATERGVALISTPFHEEAVELLRPFVDAFKIASYELTHHPLLARIAKSGLPVIMSTGAADPAEVDAAVRVLQSAGCRNLALLQCTAAYPAPPETIHCRAIPALASRYSVPVGLSDHSRCPTTAPTVAVALGAAIVEKHFTLSRHLPGPDHAFAVEPDELAGMVLAIRNAESVLGKEVIHVDPVEHELRHFARRSIFSTRAIVRGEVFSRDNVDILRRGKQPEGLPPESLPRILGARAANNIAPGSPVQDADVELPDVSGDSAVSLRPAQSDDAMSLFEWANDSETRAASFQSDPISLSEHMAWFESSLKSDHRHMMLAIFENQPAAFVRLDGNGPDATVSLNVAPRFRGRGLGKKILRAVDGEARRLNYRVIHARIRPDNERSIRTFEAAGYRRLPSAEDDSRATRYLREL